ncbi:MAG: cystathionine beta-synthase [Candidatus Krumholzibacteriia bacterium]
MPERLSQVKYSKNVLETIGDTPLIRLNNVTKGVKATVLAKAECYNPGGSVKDRIGVKMIEDAVERGELKPGGTIVECTSGNTGVGLALVAAVMGYKAVFTMPDKMSQEKIRLLKSFGADVITCPTAVPPESEESYYSVAKRIVEQTPNALLANQYFNPVNPRAHYETTGPEIWKDTGGKIDYFVAGVGTGGTISGVGRYLKEQNPSVRIVGADPEGSILRDFFYTKKTGTAHPYLVEGIGEDIVPSAFEYQYVDDIITVGDRESFNMARRLSREEGLMVGGSCGSAVAVALEVARTLGEDKIVVVLLPDSGERYLSKFHSDEWMRENRMLDTKQLTVGDFLEAKSTEIPPVAYVKVTDSVHAALAQMKEFGVTQLPVKRDEDWTGRVSEGELLDRLLAGKVTGDDTVEALMEDPFPVLSIDAHYADALKLFSKGTMAILVVEDGGTRGILTKADLVEYMLSEIG